MTARLYGIPNCDKVRQARVWFTVRGLQVDFVDFKRTPPTRDLIERWLAHVDVSALVNRTGTTWRRLPEEARAAAMTRDGAIALMLSQPSVIRRPLVERGSLLIVGFDADRYSGVFHG